MSLKLQGTTLLRTLNVAFLLTATGIAFWRSGSAQDGRGTLKLDIVEESTGKPTVARAELLDRDGRAHVAGDALPIVAGSLEELADRIKNPYTGTEQFYVNGSSKISLPGGVYRLTLTKGPEYKAQRLEIRIRSKEVAEKKVAMSRWIHLPRQGWHSSDGHLHLSRLDKKVDAGLMRWMEAEDISVANLLQYGNSEGFDSMPQYAHGPGGVYRSGDRLLAAGQENPRTLLLGHTIILGARSAIHFPEEYLHYAVFWEEARRQGALSGYAHFGVDEGPGSGDAHTGLAIDLPGGLLAFLEVLQSGDLICDVWYDALNSGFRLTPTAGTDYPYWPSIPGRERFYTKVEGPLTYEAWLEGVRRGRTFVTNGPLLEFRVEGKGLGDDVLLDRAGAVTVEGLVRFDPARDEVRMLEVIENGRVLRQFPHKGKSDEIRCSFRYEAKEACWLALRAWGQKGQEESREETLWVPSKPEYQTGLGKDLLRSGKVSSLPSLAHTAAVYVMIKGSPKLADHPRAKALAPKWLARLEKLEERLGEGRVQELATEGTDGVSIDRLRANRKALLQAIQSAKKRFKRL